MIDIPGYHLVQRLGDGSATVYLAIQRSLGRRVVLKVLSPMGARDPVVRKRFLREAAIAAQLHHPNIVTVHDVGEIDGRPYTAVAYEPGGSVAALPQPVSLERALAIVRDVAVALDFAHVRGIVHRDVKPANILIREDGGYVLCDFGIAQAAGGFEPLTKEDENVGSPLYMSPEQLAGRRVDGRADLYSLGIVLFELLTGRAPYRGDDAWEVAQKHLSAPLPSLPPYYARLQPLLDRLLAKSPDDRLRNAAKLVRRIDALRAQLHAVPPEPRRRRFGLFGFAMSAVALVALALGAWSMWQGLVPAPLVPLAVPIAAKAPATLVPAPRRHDPYRPERFRRVYAMGLDAFKDGRWFEVETLMAEALRGEPYAYHRMKLYGMRFEHYTPHTYLGVAAYMRGDCATALPHLEDPPSRDALRRANALALLERAESAARECVARTSASGTASR